MALYYMIRFYLNCTCLNFYLIYFFLTISQSCKNVTVCKSLIFQSAQKLVLGNARPQATGKTYIGYGINLKVPAFIKINPACNNEIGVRQEY